MWYRASLVVQWLRICLAMQGAPVRSLVWEDPTCHRATKPESCSYWLHTLQLLKPARPEQSLCSATREAKRSPHTTRKSSPPHPITRPLLTTTRESPTAATQTHHSQKVKKINKSLKKKKKERKCGMFL